jgi:hypothetical protein
MPEKQKRKKAVMHTFSLDIYLQPNDPDHGISVSVSLQARKAPKTRHENRVLNYKQRYHLHQSSFQKFIVILFGSRFFFSSKLFILLSCGKGKRLSGLNLSSFLHFFLSATTD